MSSVDIIFAVVLAFAMVRGYSRGLLGTAATYVAPVLAFVVAAEWSDPVRERLASTFPAPDFVLDILAPLIVFVVVVATVRLAAAFFARLLGVGLSVPGRALAAFASVVVSAVVLGSFVLIVREMHPPPRTETRDAGDVLVGPLGSAMADLDRRFSESALAPRLGDLASIVISEATLHGEGSPLPKREEIEDAARKAAGAAASAISGRGASGPAPQRPDAAGKGSSK